jgi:hypothetical protein
MGFVKYGLFLICSFAGLEVLGGEFDQRPYLYLDGKKFADVAAQNLCVNSAAMSFRNYRHFTFLYSGIRGFDGSSLTRVSSSAQKSSAKKIDAVANWLRAQPANSVTPLGLLETAVKVENSNVLEALRLTYNLLSAERKKGANTPLTAKLIDITGEQLISRNAFKNKPKRLLPIGLSTRGGKLSSWYHFFGAAAVAYDEATKPTAPIRLNCRLQAANAKLMGTIVGTSLVDLENILDGALLTTLGFGSADYKKVTLTITRA